MKSLRRKILNSDDEGLKEQVRLLENDVKFLFEQAEKNKRYCEAIERAMDKEEQRLNGYGSVVFNVLEKALEGESE